jgi:hypothetical protein
MAMTSKKLFQLNDKLLRWSGFWPDHEENWVKKIQQLLKMGFFLVVTIGWVLYPELYYLYVHRDSVQLLSLGFTYFISVLLCVWKMGVFIVYRRDLAQLIKDMQEKWEKCL